MNRNLKQIFNLFKKNKKLTFTVGGLTTLHAVSMMSIPFIFREIQLLSNPETKENKETQETSKNQPKNPLEHLSGSSSQS
jgi:hypothetical protein